MAILCLLKITPTSVWTLAKLIKVLTFWSIKNWTSVKRDILMKIFINHCYCSQLKSAPSWARTCFIVHVRLLFLQPWLTYHHQNKTSFVYNLWKKNTFLYSAVLIGVTSNLNMKKIFIVIAINRGCSHPPPLLLSSTRPDKEKQTNYLLRWVYSVV